MVENGKKVMRVSEECFLMEWVIGGVVFVANCLGKAGLIPLQ